VLKIIADTNYILGPTEEQEDAFIMEYLKEWNANSPDQLTLEQIRYELDQHRPYVLMEQMLFLRNWNKFSLILYVIIGHPE